MFSLERDQRAQDAKIHRCPLDGAWLFANRPCSVPSEAHNEERFMAEWDQLLDRAS